MHHASWTYLIQHNELDDTHDGSFHPSLTFIVTSTVDLLQFRRGSQFRVRGPQCDVSDTRQEPNSYLRACF